MKLARTLVIAWMGLLVGCVSAMVPAPAQLGVGPASPRPNAIVDPHKAPAALVIATEIPDAFTIPASGSVRDVPVHGWRTTLEAGFKNTYAQAASGRKLELIAAELSFAPAAVSRGATAAVIAQIRYKARLVGDEGQELGAFAGTVQAREADVTPNEPAMTANASMAVEAMYEQLSSELVAKY